MSWFLNPGMLLFAACGAIPIIIHLFNRQQYKRIAWAAMEFLLAAIKRTQSRLRLENLLLLLARIAIMILLALALAQPLLENNPLAGLESNETHLILVIDNSYSMGLTRAGRPSPLETARGLASEMLGRLDASRGDKVSLIMMSDEPDAVIAEPSMQIDFAKKKVVELELSDYGTSAIRTLPLALAAAKKSTNARKDLILLTDAQRLAWNLEESEKDKFHQMLTELSAVPGMHIRIIDVGAEDTANVAVERVTSADAVIGVNQSYKFSARLHNFGRTESQRYLTWYVDGTKHDAVAVTIGAGEEATVDLNLVLPEAGPHTLTAELDADAISADNKASLAFDAKQSVQVLLVDGEPSSDTFEDEVIFLRLALNPSMTADERVTLYDIETVRDIVFSETDVRRYDLVIIANLEMIYEENAANLEAYVKAGGGVLFFLGKRINPKGWNDMLYKDGAGVLPAELTQIQGDPKHESVVYFEKPDFTHPALEFFRHLQSKLTGLMIYEYYGSRIDAKRPDVRVLARYSDAEESPAILEKLYGRGKSVVVTTSADLDWNEMIKDQGFVILVDQLAKYLVGQPQGLKNVRVGSPIEFFLRADQFNRTFSLVTPKSGSASLSPSQLGDSGFVLVYRQTAQSGVYALERLADDQPGAGAGNQVLAYFAVNVDPLEGNLERINEEELRQRFPELKFTWQRESGGAVEEGAKPDKPPRSSRVWRLLAYATLAFLLAEMFMAQRFGARR